MTKGSWTLDRDINKRIGQNSLVARAQKVLRILGQILHILPALHLIRHMLSFKVFIRAYALTNKPLLKLVFTQV